jgi:hypothetical protein
MAPSGPVTWFPLPFISHIFPYFVPEDGKRFGFRKAVLFSVTLDSQTIKNSRFSVALNTVRIMRNCTDVDGNKSTLLLLLLLLFLLLSYLCGIQQLKIYSLSFGDQFFKSNPLCR